MYVGKMTIKSCCFSKYLTEYKYINGITKFKEVFYRHTKTYVLIYMN